MTTSRLITGSLEDFMRECALQVGHDMVAVMEAEVDDDWMRGALSYHLGWAESDFTPLPPERRTGLGKKVRPALAVLSYQCARLAFHGRTSSFDSQDPIPFASAVELVHNFSLVHDDIEDGDRYRRGRPTLWSLYGPAQAMNAGDCFHALAYSSLGRLSRGAVDRGLVAGLMSVLADATVKMSIGQRRDMSYEVEVNVDSDDYLEMIGGKTAAIIGCATYGGALLALGDANATARHTLLAYGLFGRHLGLSFQIRDDILGIWGTNEETGKPVGSDIRRRKKSLPVVIALRESVGDDRRCLERLYGLRTELSTDQVAEVRAILDRGPAQAQAQHQAEFHARQAREALAEVAKRHNGLHENPFLELLWELTDFITSPAR